MDSMILLGQKNTLAEYMILFGAANRTPMLDKDLYDSWKSIMELYITKKYAELSAAEKIQADYDMKATNIILQGLPAEIYSLVNHHRVAKDLWERVQLLMQGDDLIACLNKAMVVLTIGRKGQSYSGTGYKSNATTSGGNNASGHARVVKCYNCQGEGHMARQCTQPKRPRNATWYKEKALLAEAQEVRQILDEE
ncbi:retrovirus-related pol polyprotein from transposon TNT 1-94 [Tanacetum coccineum]